MRGHDSGRACHPKFRASTLRFYSLDESVASSARDQARGAAAVYPGYDQIPSSVQGPTPFARRFTNLVSSSLREATTDAEVVAAALLDWTVHVLVRNRAPVNAPMFQIAGAFGDATGAENFLCSVYVNSQRALTSVWEHSVGVNATFTSPVAVVPLNEWVLVTARKRDTTGGPGPGGTAFLDFFVNGTLVASSGSLVNAGNPVASTAVVAIGGSETTTPASIEVGSFDIAHASFHAEALSTEEIEEDARRFRLLPFFTRCDLAVNVVDFSGRTVALTDLDGKDVVLDAKIADDNDAGTATASLTLLREEGDDGLAGLRTEVKWNLDDVLDPLSYSGLLREGRTPIEIFVGRVPLGLRAESRDLFSRFVGRIDEVNEGSEAIAVECRDSGGILIDTFIEEEVNYSDPDTPFAVEGEMQFLLNDNDNNAGNNSVSGLYARTESYDPITLYTPTSPGWAVLQWRQRREPVLAALRTLAGQIGWEVRYLYDQNPDSPGWKLTFFEPPRGRLDSDLVLSPSEILSVSRLNRSIFNVRNVVRVVYPSSETTPPSPPAASGYVVTNGWVNIDGEEQRVAAFLQIESTASLTLFEKRLFCEFAEEGSSQLDTVAEAFDMAYGAVRDLEEPEIDKSITIAAIPELDVNDMLGVRPIRQLFTVAQRLAVRSLTHSFGETSETTLELRGKPSLGYKRWLALEARPGNAKPGVYNPYDALTDVRPGTLLSTVRNVLDRSSYLTGGKFLQLRNGDFGAFSAGLENPPDAWFMHTGAWKTDADVIIGISLSGGKALHLKTSTVRVRSDFVPINGSYDTPHSFEIVWQWPSGSAPVATTKRPELTVEWYDSAKVFLGVSTIRVGGPSSLYPPFQFPDVTAAAGTWYTSRVDGVSPPSAGTARFLRLRLGPDTDGTRTMLAQGIYVDGISAYRTAREDKTFLLNNFAIVGGSTGAAAWYCINLRSAAGAPASPPPFDSHDWGHNHFIYSGGLMIIPREDGTNESFGGTFRGAGFYCKEAGTYLVTATTTLLWNTAGTPPNPLARLVKNATYTASTNPLNTGGTVVAQAIGSQWDTLTNYNNGTAVAGFLNAQVSTVTMTTRVTLALGDRLTFEFQRGVALAITIQPLTASEVANYQQLNWWTVRLALVE